MILLGRLQMLAFLHHRFSPTRDDLRSKIAVDDNLSELRTTDDGDDAYGCLPILLEVSLVRRDSQTP